jgi:hypothetical protein
MHRSTRGGCIAQGLERGGDRPPAHTSFANERGEPPVEKRLPPPRYVEDRAVT